MRHREQSSPYEALCDWRLLRRKVDQEGGLQYEKPVLVRFADRGTFEVMDRDIVEDVFYVRRPFKIVRELDARGADLEQAIRDLKGGEQRQPQQQRMQAQGRDGRGPRAPGRARRGGRSRRGSRRGGKPQGGPPKQ